MQRCDVIWRSEVAIEEQMHAACRIEFAQINVILIDAESSDIALLLQSPAVDSCWREDVVHVAMDFQLSTRTPRSYSSMISWLICYLFLLLTAQLKDFNRSKVEACQSLVAFVSHLAICSQFYSIVGTVQIQLLLHLVSILFNWYLVGNPVVLQFLAAKGCCVEYCCACIPHLTVFNVTISWTGCFSLVFFCFCYRLLI